MRGSEAYRCFISAILLCKLHFTDSRPESIRGFHHDHAGIRHVSRRGFRQGEYWPESNSNNQAGSICLKPHCVLSSATIIQALDTTINPCEDFYKYSCGGWQEERDEAVDDNRFREVEQQITKFLHKILERKSYKSDGKAVQKAQDFYQACLNTTRTEEAGGDPLKQVIKLLGGWSFLEATDLETSTDLPLDYLSIFADTAVSSSSDTLIDTLIASHQFDSTPLFGIQVWADDKNSSTNIIQLFQDGLFLLSPEFYEDKDLIEAYKDLGAFTALLLKYGYQFNPKDKKVIQYYVSALKKMSNIVEFESALAKAFLPYTDYANPVDRYHKMTVAQFAALIPALDISSYLNGMFQSSIPDDEEVLVYTPEYFVRLNYILEKIDSSIVKDYIVLQTIAPMLNYLSSEFQQILSEFYKVFFGETGGAFLWEVCVSRTRKAMGEVTGALFVQELIPQDTKDKVQDILQFTRQTFIDKLPLLDWMEESTKANAYAKAKAVGSKIGWPDWITDMQQVDERTIGIQVDPYDSFLNMLWESQRSVRNNLGRHGNPVDKNEFDFSADTVNAYYSPSNNEMIFPAGILQPPFFSPTNPMAINYGALGSILGHEFIHGFDNSGRQYNEFGNLKDWWDSSSEYQYEQRAQCLVDQYGNYTVLEGVNIDGLLTLGENIADNGGLRNAYQAFHSWLKTQPLQPHREKFPGLQDFTPEQLFFIGNAQMWCQTITEETAYINAYTDPHAQMKFRVQGMMSNMPEFARAFQCPAGSPMNPEDKCRVW